MLCHELFSAIQPPLPAVGRVCVGCAVPHPWPAQRQAGRQSLQRISLVGLASSFLLEAQPSRNEHK